ncbi:MAG: DAK2 domain-containing protein [Angelakisella sp.]
MINGKELRDAIISAANNIHNQRQRVDALNVFPVPDGDTGTNMSMTMNAAKQELLSMSDSASVYEVAHTASAALLRGARGNSGVITSLLFRGFSKGLKDKTTADSADLAAALSIGVAAAYKAVMKPTEGTMLTVARVAAEEINKQDIFAMSVSEMWNAMLDFAQDTLNKTPEMLPVLKKAGVVDAGGEGLLCIYQGMKSVFDGNGIVPAAGAVGNEAPIYEDPEVIGDYDGEITFCYCTEFIVLKDKEAENPRDPLTLRAYLESIGDSAVVVDDDDIIKCHVHTNDPGNAIQEALKFGMLTKLKVDNMKLQFAEKQEQKKSKALGKVPIDPDIPYGFVAVAAGEGVEKIFSELGASHVVSGGQTMNPSTEDILMAIEATPSKIVYVLPNNKNIIMAAEQASKLTSTRTVKVIPTRSIPQGLGAMLAFDPENDVDGNTIAMKNAAENVGTGQITFAARDSDYDGHKIKEGELLALENGKVAFTEHDLTRCTIKLTKSLLQKDTSFVTLIYGSDVTDEQAAELETAVREKLPKDVELALINGGQPVYYLIISVE